MSTWNLKNLIAFLGLLSIAGCGGGDVDMKGTHGALAVKVTNAKSFNPKVEHGRIERYVVRIEGDGITEPIVAEFPGSATEGVVEGVPVGGNRTVSVEAKNPNSVVIRAGEEPGVSVGDGETSVEVALEAVPIFTNLTDGAAIDNTRLVFRLFSDPGRPLMIEDSTGGGGSPLADASTNLPQVNLDQATGLGQLAPGLIAPGERGFVVRDLITGRGSSVSIRLLDGTERKAAPFVAAGMISVDATSALMPIGLNMCQ